MTAAALRTDKTLVCAYTLVPPACSRIQLDCQPLARLIRSVGRHHYAAISNDFGRARAAADARCRHERMQIHFPSLSPNMADAMPEG